MFCRQRCSRGFVHWICANTERRFKAIAILVRHLQCRYLQDRLFAQKHIPSFGTGAIARWHKTRDWKDTDNIHTTTYKDKSKLTMASTIPKTKKVLSRLQSHQSPKFWTNIASEAGGISGWVMLSVVFFVLKQSRVKIGSKSNYNLMLFLIYKGLKLISFYDRILPKKKVHETILCLNPWSIQAQHQQNNWLLKTSLRGRRKKWRRGEERGGGWMREKSAKTGKREGSACYKRSWNTSAKRETQIKVLKEKLWQIKIDRKQNHKIENRNTQKMHNHYSS